MLIFGWQIFNNSLRPPKLRSTNNPSDGDTPLYDSRSKSFRWSAPKYKISVLTSDVAIGNDWANAVSITVDTTGPVELRVMLNVSDSGFMRVQRDGSTFIDSLAVTTNTNRETFGDSPSNGRHTYTVQCDNLTTARTGSFIAVWEP